MTTFSETNVTHPAPHRTHTVLNQSVPRTDVNEFTLDTVLSEGVRRHDADWATAELTDIGDSSAAPRSSTTPNSPTRSSPN